MVAGVLSDYVFFLYMSVHEDLLWGTLVEF